MSKEGEGKGEGVWHRGEPVRGKQKGGGGEGDKKGKRLREKICSSGYTRSISPLSILV